MKRLSRFLSAMFDLIIFLFFYYFNLLLFFRRTTCQVEIMNIWKFGITIIWKIMILKIFTKDVINSNPNDGIAESLDYISKPDFVKMSCVPILVRLNLPRSRSSPRMCQKTSLPSIQCKLDFLFVRCH